MEVIYLFIVTTTAAALAWSDPKSVNLALEASFLFKPEDVKQDLTFVKNLRKFLGKIEKVLHLQPRGQILRAVDEHADRDDSGEREKEKDEPIDKDKNVLSRFLGNLGNVLQEQSDDDLGNLTDTLVFLLKGYDYPESVFHKIFTDPKLKIFLENILMEWTQTEPKDLKENLAYNQAQNSSFMRFAAALDDFYDMNDYMKLKKLLKKISKPSPDMTESIKNAINFFVFERYETLNYTCRAKLMDELEILSKYVVQHYKEKTVEANRRFHEEVVSFEDSDEVQTRAISIETTTQDKESGDDTVKNEIILNKNLEIEVRSADAVPEYDKSMKFRVDNETTMADEVTETTTTKDVLVTINLNINDGSTFST